MPTLPSGPSGREDIRTTLLFRTHLKGREKKAGRPLTEDELVELEAFCRLARGAGVHVASQSRSVVDASKAAVSALPKQLPLTLLPTDGQLALEHDFSKSVRRRVGRAIGDVGKLLAMAVREGRVGKPELPAYARKTSALYIQQDDLEDFIPDEWGQRFTAETGALGRAVGLPPAAIPLLCLLQWTSSFRPAHSKDRHGAGAGFQVSLDWLARKLGVTRTWVQELLNRLDPCAAWRRGCLEVARENRRRAKKRQPLLKRPERPTGTVFIHRFRRLRRYQDIHPEGARRPVWFDSNGRPHVYVDVRGVVYLTDAGRRVLGSSGEHLDAAADVARGGIRRRWLLSARLRRGHHLLGGHAVEVLENRRELLAAPGVPENLSPNHFLQKRPPPHEGRPP